MAALCVTSHTSEPNSRVLLAAWTPAFYHSHFCWPAFSRRLSFCFVFNFRSCRPNWPPWNCLRDWRSLWGATILTTAPWLPTERFTMKEPTSPPRRTDPAGPEEPWPQWIEVWTSWSGAISLQEREVLKRGWRSLHDVNSWWPRPTSSGETSLCFSLYRVQMGSGG